MKHSETMSGCKPEELNKMKNKKVHGKEHLQNYFNCFNTLN